MKKIVFSAFLMLIFLNLFGKEIITIEEAISYALNFNPEIKKFSERLKGLEGRKMQKEAYPNPELIFSKEGLPGKSNLERETNLGILQTIEFPGKRKLRKNIGEIEEEIGKIELERVKKIVIARVKKTYFKAKFAQEKIRLLKDIEEIIRDYIESATFKYQSGEVSFTDILRGRIEALKLKNEILEAKKELREEVNQLGRIIGKRLNGEVEFLSPLQFIQFDRDLKELIEEPELFLGVKIEELKLQLARNEVDLSEKNFYPDLRIGFFYPSLRAGGWGFELGVSLPIFQKGLKGALMEANSLKLENQISLETKKREIISKIESLYSNLKVSEEIIKNYENSIFPELDILFSSSLSYYQSGIISALEFFDILKTYKSVRIEYKKEILNYVSLIADIESAGEEE